MDALSQLEILDKLVEVEIQENDFLKVVETLTRIGVSSSYEKKLYPSCHVLHKQGRYWITHFKHLMALDGLSTDISETDVVRYDTICLLLDQWGLVRIIYPERINNKMDLRLIKIVPYRDKSQWTIVPKFTIGK